MLSIEQYINSGILEQYVLGLTTTEESIEVTNYAKQFIEIQKEIEEIETALQLQSLASFAKPNIATKAFLLATIDYTERLKNGEIVLTPPILNEHSTIKDFDKWLKRPDMFLPENSDELFGKIICANEQATTVIAWLKSYAPSEVHDNEYERFLIIEGSCEIIIENKIHTLSIGNYMQIPLGAQHHLNITSSIPCKVILQRVAA